MSTTFYWPAFDYMASPICREIRICSLAAFLEEMRTWIPSNEIFSFLLFILGTKGIHRNVIWNVKMKRESNVFAVFPSNGIYIWYNMLRALNESVYINGLAHSRHSIILSHFINYCIGIYRLSTLYIKYPLWDCTIYFPQIFQDLCIYFTLFLCMTEKQNILYSKKIKPKPQSKIKFYIFL